MIALLHGFTLVLWLAAAVSFVAAVEARAVLRAALGLGLGLALASGLAGSQHIDERIERLPERRILQGERTLRRGYRE